METTDKDLYDSNILARTLKYASTFTTNEGIYSHFFFTNTGVITTDGTFLFKAELKGSGLPNATLPVRNMLKFLSVCPEGQQVSWQYGINKNSVIFKAGSYQSQIPNTYIDSIPSPKDLFGEPLKNIKQKPKQSFSITTDLIQAMNKISFCKAPLQDAEKQEIQGIRIEKDGIYSTDSYGISSVLMETHIKDPFTIPAKLVEFITSYALPPQACYITKDYIILKYNTIMVIGRTNNYPYPEKILSQVREFNPTTTITFKEKADERSNILKRLSVSEGTTLLITPVDSSTLEFSISDRLGNKTSEQVEATNALSSALMTGFKFFRNGYKNTTDIGVAELPDSRIQLMFSEGSFKFTILGRSVQ